MVEWIYITYGGVFVEFLQSGTRVDLLYDDVPLEQTGCQVAVDRREDVLTTVYTFPDGVRLTNVARKYPDFGAYEWVNYLENPTDHPSGLIHRLWDCAVTLPLPKEPYSGRTAYLPDSATATKVFHPGGSVAAEREFFCAVDETENNRRLHYLRTGDTRRYRPAGGRSSDAAAPFFNIHKEGRGYICAVGWTGQWLCELSRREDGVTIRSGVEDSHFRLLPGERARTSSVVILPYEGTVTYAQNVWRRLIKTHFSLVGSEGRDPYGPLFAMVWGGMPSSASLERVNTIRANRFPFDYVWMDAGWYGGDAAPSPDEFEGDWGAHTGDWRVSPLIHPKGLKDVAQAVHEAGMKFMLWMEPERVRVGTPATVEHPEYFIPRAGDPGNKMLDLGNEEAWQYAFAVIAGLIEDVGVDGYRQDFNFPPLDTWRLRDTEERQGMTEIRHINGLYRLWDALLERFPHLLIDNCASGGRRIDIETLRRSIPAWRTDYACAANYTEEVAQMHSHTYGTWMPYSGTGTGRPYDEYRMRSAYGASLACAWLYSQREPFADTSEKVEFIRRYTAEYRQVRPYFSADFYPLTQPSSCTDVWCAAQYDRPEKGDGMV